jgi:hypothetical protein
MNVPSRTTCRTLVALLALALASGPARAISSYVSFGNEKTYDAGTTVTAVVGGHFVSGSLSDVVYAAGGKVYYQKSTGSSFNSAVQIGSMTDANKVFAQDLNRDGYDDLVVTNNVLTFYVLLSQGGTPSGSPFGGQTAYTLQFQSSGSGSSCNIGDASFGDVDNDGDVDIVIATVALIVTTSPGEGEDPPVTSYSYTGNYAVAQNLGNGSFSTNLPIQNTNASSAGEDAGSALAAMDPRITVGNFNGDGYVDIAVGYHTNVEWLSAPEVQIAPGNGTLSFNFGNVIHTGYAGIQDVQSVLPTQATAMPGPNQSAWLVIAFDSSSHTQLFNSNGTVATDNKINNTPRGPMGAVNDYNLDGIADLMNLDGHSSQILVGWDWTASNPSQSESTFGVHLGTDIQRGDDGDFDGDGHPDLVGTDGNSYNIYYNQTGTAEALFYSNNDCPSESGAYLGMVSTSTSASWDLKDSNPPVKNDQARSVTLENVSKGTVITVYDDPNGSTSDDYAVITATANIDSACISTFEQSVTTSTYTMTYYKDNGLDGKVSRIQVQAP